MLTLLIPRIHFGTLLPHWDHTTALWLAGALAATAAGIVASAVRWQAVLVALDPARRRAEHQRARAADGRPRGREPPWPRRAVHRHQPVAAGRGGGPPRGGAVPAPPASRRRNPRRWLRLPAPDGARRLPRRPG